MIGQRERLTEVLGAGAGAGAGAKFLVVMRTRQTRTKLGAERLFG